MSHKKFEHPRHGNLGFLPRKRCTKGRGRIRSFPNDDKSKKPHLTAFLGYKAGMTHIVRDLDKPGSKLHKKEVLESVTIIECPPMVVVGLVGYSETPFGLRCLATVWAQHLSEELRRRFYKNWYKSKKKAFTRHTRNYFQKKNSKCRATTINSLKKNASVIRVIAHTRISKVRLGQKKAHVVEIQVNGGDVAAKIDYALNLFEKLIPVSDVFAADEMIDVVGITKGHGFKGVVSRWGVRKLPRKTHKGHRKVACIGAWHPARVSYTVARAGQKGYFHRTELNKKIYKMGKSLKTAEGKSAATTEFDITKKNINPMGGFPHYGTVREDFLMVKGSVAGSKKRVLTLRKSMRTRVTRTSSEKVALKFVDTSSKMGNGRFQTHKEKRKFLGPMKKDLDKQRRREAIKLALAVKKGDTKQAKAK